MGGIEVTLRSKGHPAAAVMPRAEITADDAAIVAGATGPRIYNLFPPLIGSVTQWTNHIPRIAGMKFDWIYLNPFHSQGFSGSIYAIKDPYSLSECVRDATTGRDEPSALRQFTAEAGRHGIRVMMDLVINHTAKDAVLTEDHPEWYRRNADGTLYSPRAIDPDDPRKVTIWGDLAEF